MTYEEYYECEDCGAPVDYPGLCDNCVEEQVYEIPGYDEEF